VAAFVASGGASPHRADADVSLVVGAPAPAAPGAGTYTVVAGDSLYGISRKTGTAFNTLLSLNGLSSKSVIYPGQALQLSGTGTPSPGTPAPAPTGATYTVVRSPGSPGPAPTGATYTVVRGDTLYGISRKTGTDLNTLLARNGLGLNSLIVPGQVLQVDAGGPAPAPSPILERRTIGASVQGRPIVAYRLGTPGGRVVLVVGSIHGHEQTGETIAQRLRDSTPIPAGIDLWVILSANPDGTAANSRTNANGVNLNRNFTARWEAIDCAAYARSCAGPGGASEPETQALQSFIATIRPTVSVCWHGPDNVVDEALVYGANNKAVLGAYASIAGMRVATVPCSPSGYCTGNATQYSNSNFGGSSFVVELATLGRFGMSDATMDRHIRAVFAAANAG